MTTNQACPAPPGERLAWGILGTGRIARRFAQALGASQTGRLLAVGSRSAGSAAHFGDEFAVPRRYDSYEALLADAAVEAVYIALPNHLHAPWAIRAAQAGKHILCEKPLAVNQAQAATMVEAARRHDVFLMEAFMYRCHPQTARLVELIRSGAIGQVRVIQAHFGFNLRGHRPENIRLQHAAAGGSIMDVGCYCASMARLIAGAALGQPFAEPLDVKACAHIGPESQVDEWATAVLRFPGDIVANLTSAVQVAVDATLRIWGSAGHILVPAPWFPEEPTSTILVHRDDQAGPEPVRVAAGHPLYAIEADTVARHLQERQAPPPCMTWADSLGNMGTLDRWRAGIGLAFNDDRPGDLEGNRQ